VRLLPSFSPSARQSGLLLGAAFLTFAIGAACMHSYTVFLVAFIEAFGWSRGEASIAYSVSQMISGATSPLVGVLVDRLGPRRLVLIGGALLAVGLLASSLADALWQVVLLYGVVMTLGATPRSGLSAAKALLPRSGAAAIPPIATRRSIGFFKCPSPFRATRESPATRKA